MNWKRHIIEAATLVAAAVLCAVIANGMASRERKLALSSGGQPPPAVRVRLPEPAPQTASSAAPALPVTTTTAAPVVVPPKTDSGGPLSSTKKPVAQPVVAAKPK